MKKLTAILLAILLLAGCSAGEKQEKSAYDHGLELVTMLDEMSESEEYIQIYTGASSINEIVAGIGELDYSAPSNVYKITVSEENLSAMAELGRLEGASEELQSFVKQRTLAAEKFRILRLLRELFLHFSCQSCFQLCRRLFCKGDYNKS